MGRAPSAETWVEARLLPGELALWRRMSGPDRRHAVGVAERVERALGHEATRPVLAAALLHDVGKIESGSAPTAASSPRCPPRSPVPRWPPPGASSAASPAGSASTSSTTEIGGDLLELAGSDPLTVAWTREHHRPESDWTLEPAIAAALKAADDD